MPSTTIVEHKDEDGKLKKVKIISKTKEELKEEWDKKIKPCPEDGASITRLTFDWITPMIWTGWRRPLQQEDLPDITETDKTEALQKNFVKRLQYYHEKKSKRPLLMTLLVMFGPRMLLAGCLKFIFDICNLTVPLFQKWIIEWIDSDDEWWLGVIWLVVMSGLQLTAVFFTQQYFHIVNRVGMNIRSCLVSEVYEKGLRISSSAHSSFSTGKIVTLMSSDAQKIGDFTLFANMLFSGIVQIGYSLIALSFILYYPTALGVLMIILIVPTQIILFSYYAKLRKASMKHTDKRVKSINEILQGIRIIKFFTWEDNYLKRISKIRFRELFQLVKMAFVRAVVFVVLSASPVVIAVVTFSFYAIVFPDRLTANIIFPSISYFNLLRFPLLIYPMVLTTMIDANVSIKRLEGYLGAEEVEGVTKGDNPDIPIQIKEGEFQWPAVKEEEEKVKKGLLAKVVPCLGKKKKKKSKDQQDDAGVTPDAPLSNEKDSATTSGDAKDEQLVSPTDGEEAQETPQQDGESAEVGVELLSEGAKLEDINLTIKKGSLVAIVGSVGSGKSSLFNALLSEMPRNSGHVSVCGSIAYSAQHPWITNDSVKNNILFGQEMEKERFDTCIEKCAMTEDIKILPNGLDTEIGEKGLTLSGGQKVRCSLARACYQDADIYMLDDVLSALDSHVGRHVFNKCIKEYLDGKTRLLITHQLHFLNQCDEVIVMKDGRIYEHGTFDELLQKKDGEMARLLEEFGHEHDDSSSSDEDEELHKQEKLVEKAEQEKKAEIEKVNNPSSQQGLMMKEERVTGAVKFSVIFHYVRAMGGLPTLLILVVLFGVGEIFLVSSTWWMSMWISDTFDLTHFTYLGIYAFLGLTSAVGVLFRTLIFNLAGLLASKRIHSKALKRLLRAPSSFFDTTPIGRHLSRFSKDCEGMDTILISTVTQFIGTSFSIISSLIMIAYATNGIFIAVVIVLSPAYLIIQSLYRGSSREIRRLDSISRSPLFSHFTETLTGISTIRAYKAHERFKASNRQRIDTNQRAVFFQNTMQRWLGFKLESFGSILVILAAGLLMLLSRFDVFDISASQAGLGISFMSSVTGVLYWGVRQASDSEVQFNAVERMLHYAQKIPVERPAVVKKNKPGSSWPEGNIEFKDFKLRYREGLPLVLKGVNVSIKKGEKVGIVGRTGSGKSTLMLALFRLIERAEGSIVVDGVDIDSIGLKDLRKKISCIPQDPVLFSGTLRSNLDPFGQFSSAQIWDALKKVRMKDVVEREKLKLSAPVVEGGTNFSVGQRQLLCICRTLLSESRIIVMDEASANIDIESDTIIQKTIKERFKDQTVLTIAHRLNTVIESDKILVMDQGVALEFASPYELLFETKNSSFAALIDETGPANASKLRDQAYQAHVERQKELNGEEDEKALTPIQQSTVQDIQASNDVEEKEVEAKLDEPSKEEKAQEESGEVAEDESKPEADDSEEVQQPEESVEESKESVEEEVEEEQQDSKEVVEEQSKPDQPEESSAPESNVEQESAQQEEEEVMDVDDESKPDQSVGTDEN